MADHLTSAMELFTEGMNRRDYAGSEQNLHVREPDPFDGSKEEELRGFLFQLRLLWSTKPHTYNTPEKKVTSAISFLSGAARAHFDHAQCVGIDPGWLHDYDAFVDKLTLHFG